MNPWADRRMEVEKNSVYGDYSDIYTPTEIYDRNAYYAVTEDNEVETSMVTDLNPEYE